MSLTSRRESVRADRSKFIWQVGVGLCGFTMGIFFAYIAWFMEDWANHDFWFRVLKSAIGFCLGLIGGYIAGRILWMYLVERRQS